MVDEKVTGAGGHPPDPSRHGSDNPLPTAPTPRNPEFAELLTGCDSDGDSYYANNCDQIPLHRVGRLGNEEVSIRLLGRDDIELNPTDSEGPTPLAHRRQMTVEDRQRSGRRYSMKISLELG
ncbi:hypothetical protein HOY82DRAFT_184994 [Tuber indicum]|nr:hypothetical protein HOY82DRAFT_184994 [Tuber indicum]